MPKAQIPSQTDIAITFSCAMTVSQSQLPYWLGRDTTGFSTAEHISVEADRFNLPHVNSQYICDDGGGQSGVVVVVAF